MKRLGIVIIDIIGLILVLGGLGLAIFNFLNENVVFIRGFSNDIIEKIINSNNKVFLNDLKLGNLAHWISLSAIMISAIAIFLFIIGTILTIKSGSHKAITISIYVLAFIAIGFAIWGFYITTYFHNLKSLTDFAKGVIK